MSWNRTFRLLLLSAVLALAVRAATLGWAAHQNKVLTGELCTLVGNDLETGSLRNVFEGIDSGLRRSGVTGACVVVTDNGRSFTPDCVQPETSYQTVTCKAEANRGVRASVFFPSSVMLSQDLLWLFLLALIVTTFLFLSAEKFAKVIVEEFSKEISSRLDFSPQPNSRTGIIQRLALWLLKKSGVSDTILQKATVFRARIQEYETKVAASSAARARKEQEALSAKDYIEKIKAIRHDIRSPLSSLQAVRERIASDGEADRTLFSAIRRIQVMLDQLDEVDRRDEDRVLIVAEVAAEDIVFELSPKFILGKGARLRYEYDHRALSPILAGREAFERVLANLLQNAYEAVGRNGSIGLRIRSSATECVIEVEDDGCGIPENFASKIFSRGATHGKVNGIGLGLFHSKASIESWGGTLEFERLAQGTKFVARIPLAQTGVQYAAIAPGSKLKVIDDDETVISALKGSGHVVLEVAESFAAGRSLLERHQDHGIPVLIDYRLDKNQFGTDLIAEFRGRPGLLLCTDDFDDSELLRKAQSLGVNVFPKPLLFSAESLSPMKA